MWTTLTGCASPRAIFMAPVRFRRWASSCIGNDGRWNDATGQADHWPTVLRLSGTRGIKQGVRGYFWCDDMRPVLDLLAQRAPGAAKALINRALAPFGVRLE